MRDGIGAAREKAGRRSLPSNVRPSISQTQNIVDERIFSTDRLCVLTNSKIPVIVIVFPLGSTAHGRAETWSLLNPPKRVRWPAGCEKPGRLSRILTGDLLRVVFAAPAPQV